MLRLQPVVISHKFSSFLTQPHNLIRDHSLAHQPAGFTCILAHRKHLPGLVFFRDARYIHTLRAQRPEKRSLNHASMISSMPPMSSTRVVPGEGRTGLSRISMGMPPTSPESDTLLQELAGLEPDGLSPLEALQQLYELRAEARARLGVEG